MVCLIKSKNKPLLDQYTDMLGSESAAYYVLCKNNGFPLEFTPSGEKSDLFQKLLAKNGYDYEEAIQEKAQMYYSSYYNGIGGDWTMSALGDNVVDEKGEPKIDYKPQKISFSDILSEPVSFTEMDMMAMPEIQKNLIDEDRSNYIAKLLPVSTEELHSANVKWLANKQKKLVNSINKDLIAAFGLEKKIDKNGNVTFVSKLKDDFGRPQVIIQFCEYIENGKKGVYDLTGRIEAAANIIQISLLNGDPATINHELAHHYVRMFWNSEVIQNAAQKLDNGDRSDGWQVRLEEKLVDELTKRTTDAEGVWNKFSEMIKTAFLWISSPIKQSLLRKASVAFRINDQAIRIRKDLYILSFIDPNAKRVFNSVPNQKIEGFDNWRSQYGLKSAITKFSNDSVEFYTKYIQLNDSILKQEYDEYAIYVRNALTDLTVTDSEFNEIYIKVNDAKNAAMRTYQSEPNNPILISYMNVMDLVNEAREIRESTRHNSQSGVTYTGPSSQHIADISELISRIIRGLKTRAYEYMHVIPKEAQSANAVNELINKLTTLAEDIDKVNLFVSEGMKELDLIKRKMEKSSMVNYNDISSLLLLSLWNTIDGFYNPVISLIYEVLGKDTMFAGMVDELGLRLSELLALSNATRSHLLAANKVISQRETHKYLIGDSNSGRDGVIGDLLTDEQKERFLYNFDDQLIIGKLFEDINMLLPYIGLASRSRSTVLRVARNMILSANSEIRKASIKDAANIVKLYFLALPEMRKLGLKEILSVFQEMDEKGIPTGYFVRKLNYGKFYKDLDNKKDELINIANEALKSAISNNPPQITYDVYNNPVFPPDDDPVVKQILTEYADNLDEWMCQHAERMFTPEYYRKRRSMLSPHTRRVMQDIQNRINAITSKAPIVKINVNGVETEMLATWELSPEDQQNLVLLQEEYKLLSSFYYSDGSKKTSADELTIAKEITAFNEWKNSKVTYEQNEAKFEAAILKIRDKYGDNSLEEARFRKLNTSIIVDPKYYEFVLSRVNLLNNPALDSLRKKRNDLKRLIDEFDKKGIDIELKRRQSIYWDSLKEVDALIRELLDSMNNGPVPEEQKWSHYFDTELVMYDDNETLLDHMLKLDMREYRRNHPADKRDDSDLRKELIRKYQYTYTWYDNQGGAHDGVGLVSVFTRQVPKGTSIKDRKMDGKFGKNLLITKYSLQFSDISKDSELYNVNFDRQDSHLVQPKREEYQNDKQWKLIEENKNIKNLYDALIELMNRNNAKLPNNSDFNYKLPQITGRRLTILRRSGSIKEVCDALKYNFTMDWKLNERDDSDTNYEDGDLKLRANGTRINTVPVRYVKPLEHPEFITGDVIGSVIAFTEMANNFVVKTLLASQLEIVKQQLSDRLNAGLAESMNRQATTNVIKLLTNMMDDLLYANNTKMGDKNALFNRKQELLIKFFTRFLRLGRILMLGWNFTSMSVGFFESYIRGNLEAFLGKDYTLRDLMHAYANMVKYSLPMLTQIGAINARNKQVALMQWFGVSKRLTESYHGTERNRFVKVLSENVNGMFGFTLGDYANSSFLLSMALSNVRFIDNGDVKKGFYTKQTLVRAIQKSHPDMSYKDAKNAAMLLYKESEVCLEDAYEFKDGIISVKDEYKNYVTDTIENRVSGKCYQRLAEALGVVPQNDNPGYGLLILLRPLGVLRNYLFTVIARNWNWAHDLLRRYLDPNGNIVKEDDMIDGYLDIDAGNMNIGLHQGLIGWMKMQVLSLHVMLKKANSPDYTDETRELYNYAASKVGLEILSITLLVGLSTLFKAMQRGAGDDDWWVRFGYLTSVRLVNSFISVLDPTAFLEVIKNISTLISPLNDILNLVTLLSDMLGLSGHSPFEEIQSGSYKGKSRLFRDIMRVLPFGNAYEDLSMSALKSRANWYIQQDPLTWSSIGGIYDLLWGTGN